MRLGRRQYTLIFVVILALAFFFRFWGLASGDLQHDAALYSVRALGWLDYLAAEGQSTPLMWFGEIPWWGSLSFHDHPPLVFLIQNLFFKIFGDNTFAALAPFGLAGVGITGLIYFFVAKLRSAKEALLASGLFAVSAYSVWLARSGYLEGIETFFIILSIFFFLYFLHSKQKKYLFFWSVSLGLALLSKYTAVFLLPAVFLYLLFWQREIFKTKEFWLSLILLGLVLSPIIIYNTMLFQARGHFDAALSSMVGIQHPDFEVLAYREINTNFLKNFVSFFKSLNNTASLSFFVLEIMSLIYLAVKVIKKQGDKLINFLFINIIILVVMFSFADPAVRFVSIITPFLSISIALFIFDIWPVVMKKIAWVKAVILILIAVFGFELFYSFNTNVLNNPVGSEGVFYSADRFFNTGFNKLDKLLREEIISQRGSTRSLDKLYEAVYDLEGREAILIDGRIDWFSRIWHIDRYSIYNDVPIIYLRQFVKFIEDNHPGISMTDYLAGLGATDFWVIFATEAGSINQDELMDKYENQLISIGLKPEFEIKDDRDRVTFKIYHAQLN